MASTSSSPFISFTSSSTHFRGPNIPITAPIFAPTRVQFRPIRIAGAACTSTAHIASPPSSSSLYDVLGIQMDATFKEIKAAYRRLARVLHPDVVSDNRESNATVHQFIEVHEAYSTLSDPEKRAGYDRTLLFRPSAPSIGGSTSSEFSGYTRRTWETDQCW